jgi:ribosome biogenesis protein BRX1
VKRVKDDNEALGESEASHSEHDSEEAAGDDRSVSDQADQKVPDYTDDLRAFKDPDPLSKEWKNRQRVLLVCQRGIGGRYRGLLEDLTKLIPHSKRESKVERKGGKGQIDELCYERSCNNFIYFESRNHKVTDLYMWLSKSPNGPSVKFALSNIHSMDDLKLTGNCLKYSRPFLSFDGSFENPSLPHL